jgi:hypothetical protein
MHEVGSSRQWARMRSLTNGCKMRARRSSRDGSSGERGRAPCVRPAVKPKLAGIRSTRSYYLTVLLLLSIVGSRPSAHALPTEEG